MRILTATLRAVVAVALVVLTVRPGVANEQDGKPDRAAMRAKMLKRVDTNGDGKMSEDELAKARAEFAKRYGDFRKPANHRLEVVTFPQEVQDADSNMDKEALLYCPIEKPEGKIPLIVLLHGAGGTKKEGISSFKGNRDVRWVMTPANSKYVAKILVPHSRSLWDPASLNKMLDHLLSTNSDIDEDRVYCIGYSMGGKGTWEWAMSSPKRFAAIIPVAFIADLSKLKGMVDLPIWAMVGTADRRRAGSIPAMEKALKELGSTAVRTTIFEGANHGTTAAKAWAEEGLLDWLFMQSRKK